MKIDDEIRKIYRRLDALEGKLVPRAGRPPDLREKAFKELRVLLTSGPVIVQHLEVLRLRMGVGKVTWRAARLELGGKARKVGKTWCWYLGKWEIVSEGRLISDSGDRLKARLKAHDRAHD